MDWPLLIIHTGDAGTQQAEKFTNDDLFLKILKFTLRFSHHKALKTSESSKCCNVLNYLVAHLHSWASASRKLTPASAFRHAEF
jgi:hypothetical protein